MSKSLFSSLAAGLMIFGTGIAIAVPAEKTLPELEADAQNIKHIPPEIKTRDPLFFAWLQQQYGILDRLAANIRNDLTQGHQTRAAGEQKDFALMLQRIKTEIAWVKTAPDLIAGGQLNVKDFGAKGDGITDDTLAIRKTIAAALNGKARTVFLPRGKYRVSNRPEERPVQSPWSRENPAWQVTDDHHPDCRGAIVIKGSNLQLTGEPGTELLVDSPQDTAIHIVESDNVRISNLKISYIKPGYVSGTIIAIPTPEAIDVELEPGATDPLQGYFRERSFKGLLRFYSEGHQPNSNRPEYSNDALHQIAPVVTKIKDNVYRFTFKNSVGNEARRVGQHITYYARTYVNHAIFNYDSVRTRLDNLCLTGSPAVAFTNFNSEMPFVTNCTVESEPGQYTSTDADAFFFKSGFGGYIANNTIRNVGDDFINIHSRMSPVQKQEGNTLYLPMKIWPERYWQTASRLGYVLSSQGEHAIKEEVGIVKYEIVPVSAGNTEKGLVKVTCDRAIPALVTLENCLPDQLPDVITMPDLEWHGLVITGNRFEHSVARVLFGGRNINITDNIFLDSLNSHSFGLAGMETVSKAGGEARFPRNLLFAGNQITAKAKTIINFTSHINPKLPKSGPPSTEKNIVYFFVENNKIELYGDSDLPVFLIRDADNLVIRNNRINASGKMTGPVFELKDSSRITFQDNIMSGSFPAMLKKLENVINLTENGNRLETK